jgi:hypothetical protein
LLLTKFLSRRVLEQCVELSSSLPGGQGYVGLAHFRIHTIHDSDGKPDESADHLDKAKAARRVKLLAAKPQHRSFAFGEDDEAAYVALVPFLLW